jgi:hypothetical protein
VPGVDAPPAAPAGATPFLRVVQPQPVALPSAPPAPTPFKPKPLNGGDGKKQTEEAALDESDVDEDDLENSMSLAAIEPRTHSSRRRNRRRPARPTLKSCRELGEPRRRRNNAPSSNR